MSKIIRTDATPILAKVVEYHGFIFTQGLVTTNAELDLAGQTHDILSQADQLLELHGTDNSRILQAQVWLKQMADREAFNAIWSAWLPPGAAPARAAVQAVLADPRWLVEIMLITTK